MFRNRMLFGALALAAVMVSPKAAFGGWWDDLFEDKVLPLQKVLDAPESYRGHTVSFVVQFHRCGDIENPYYTKFQTDWFVNFSAWGDGAALWEKDVYKKDFPHLFVKRGTDLANAILQAPIYSRWVITGEVADVFRGSPWIEVRALKRLDLALDEPTLVRLVKGGMLKDLGRHDAAAAEYHAADHKALPLAVRTFAMRLEAESLHASGKTALGIARLSTALQVWEEDVACKSAIKNLRASMGLDADGHPLPGTTTPAGIAVKSEFDPATPPVIVEVPSPTQPTPTEPPPVVEQIPTSPSPTEPVPPVGNEPVPTPEPIPSGGNGGLN